MSCSQYTRSLLSLGKAWCKETLKTPMSAKGKRSSIGQEVICMKSTDRST